MRSLLVQQLQVMLRIGIGAFFLSQPASAQSSFKGDVVLKAPYDSYVCFNMSIQSCAQQVLGQSYASVFASTWDFKDGTLRYKIHVDMADARSGLRKQGLGGVRSGDEVWDCRDQLAHLPALARLDLPRKVLFFSTEHYLRLGDAFSKIERISAACSHLFDVYWEQVKTVASQEQAARIQDRLQFFDAEVENFTLRMGVLRDWYYCFSMPNAAAIKGCRDQLAKFPPAGGIGELPEGAEPPMLFSALTTARQSVADAQVALQRHARNLLILDMKAKAKQLSLDLEDAYRELSRIYVLIELSGWEGLGVEVKQKMVGELTPIQKGEPVLKYRMK